MTKLSECSVGSEVLVVYRSKNTGERVRRVRVKEHTTNGTLIDDLEVKTGNTLRLFKDDRVTYLHVKTSLLMNQVVFNNGPTDFKGVTHDDIILNIYNGWGEIKTLSYKAGSKVSVDALIDSLETYGY